MTTVGAWVLGTILALWLIDRGLLALEARRWINYRRSKGAWRGAAYHSLEMQSIFDPGIQHVLEVQVKEEQEEDEVGDPPGSPEEGGVAE